MQVNAWSKHEIYCTPMSHLNFSFLMIIVIWLVYLVPLVDSCVTSQQEDYETTSWPRLAILVSFKNTYVLCHLSFRFNNSNLDTKCTFLAVCRAALQFFFYLSSLLQLRMKDKQFCAVKLQYMMDKQEIQGREPHEFLESCTVSVVWLTMD